MKTLLLLRHAKADREAPVTDKERTLTDRGRRDAMRVGAALHSLAERVDRIVTSDALRARQTAEIAASSAGYGGPVEEDSDIYYTDAETLTGVVKGLSDTDDCVVMVGHNPSFEDLAGLLAAEGTPAISLGTANVAVLAFDVPRWRDVRPGTGRLVKVYSPKHEG